MFPQAGSLWRATPRDPAPGSGACGASRRGKGARGDSARVLCSIWRAKRVRREGWQLKGLHRCARASGCSWPSFWESKSSLSPSSCTPQTPPAELVHQQDLICANPPLSCKPLLPSIQKILQHLSPSVNQSSKQTCEIVMDCLIWKETCGFPLLLWELLGAQRAASSVLLPVLPDLSALSHQAF